MTSGGWNKATNGAPLGDVDGSGSAAGRSGDVVGSGAAASLVTRRRGWAFGEAENSVVDSGDRDASATGSAGCVGSGASAFFAVVFLATDFFATVSLAAAFFAVVFLAGAFFAVVLLAGVFFAGAGSVGFVGFVGSLAPESVTGGPAGRDAARREVRRVGVPFEAAVWSVDESVDVVVSSSMCSPSSRGAKRRSGTCQSSAATWSLQA
ncbi:MAG: hypothetical protein ACRDP1_04195 [Nocardioidaceae bacterium]